MYDLLCLDHWFRHQKCNPHSNAFRLIQPGSRHDSLYRPQHHRFRCQVCLRYHKKLSHIRRTRIYAVPGLNRHSGQDNLTDHLLSDIRTLHSIPDNREDKGAFVHRSNRAAPLLLHLQQPLRTPHAWCFYLYLYNSTNTPHWKDMRRRPVHLLQVLLRDIPLTEYNPADQRVSDHIRLLLRAW